MGIVRSTALDFYHVLDDLTPSLRTEDLLVVKSPQKFIFPCVFGVLYILMLLFFPGIQKKHKFLHDRPVLMKRMFVGWNTFLCIYSAITFLIFILDTWYVLDQNYNYSFFLLACSPDCLYFQDYRINIFWGYLFAISKFFEMFDTFLLILKKPERPVKFLHWYHHLSVMVLTWYAESYHLSIGHIAITMNAFIHTLMYYYYAVVALGMKKLPWYLIKIPPMFLTCLQISQMFIGVAMTLAWAYGYVFGDGCCCNNVKLMVPMMGVIYFSYLLLFLQFLQQKYFGKKKKVPHKKEK